MFKTTESEPLLPKDTDKVRYLRSDGVGEWLTAEEWKARDVKSDPLSREDIYEELAKEVDLSGYWPRAKDCMRPDGTMPVRHPDSERFHALLKEVGDLHDHKQSTYGRPDSPFSNYMSAQELGIAPWRYVIARVCEKISRLQSFANAVYNAGNQQEQTIRELKDIAACSLIAIVLLEKSGNKI